MQTLHKFQGTIVKNTIYNIKIIIINNKKTLFIDKKHYN